MTQESKPTEASTFTPIPPLIVAEVKRLRDRRDAAILSHMWEAAETYHQMLIDVMITRRLPR